MPRTTYNTAGKRIVVDFLSKNHEKQYTVDQLYEGLSEAGASVGKSSLYRLLEKLFVEGTVRKFKGEKNSFTAFQYVGSREDCESHLHLKCTECGRLVHLECPSSIALLSHVYEEHGFFVDNKKSVLYGICKKCGEEKQ